jgi:hypothetical protein
MEEGLALLAAVIVIGVITRGMWRDRRHHGCPVCGGNDLAMVDSYRWSGKRADGARTGGARSEYRCGGCGESLFSELSTGLMTNAEHEQWIETKLGRGGDAAPPVARVHRKRRWWW